jgi:mRNA-degrading endonuclease toxin of MazEF toxin-antitoxin module
MVVVSRHDPDAPRALSLFVPFTTKNRSSRYEVEIGRTSFLREQSWANVQGTVAVGNEKLLRRLGCLTAPQYSAVRIACVTFSTYN